MNNLSQTRTKHIKFISVIITVLIALALIMTCVPTAQADDETKYNCIDDFDGKILGTLTGGIYDIGMKERLPNCKIEYFQSAADGCQALESGKIDGYVGNEPEIIQVMFEKPNITYLKEYLIENVYGIIFNKDNSGNALYNEFNEYLKELKEAGKLEALQEKWFESDCNQTIEMDNAKDLPATNGKLKIAVCSSNAPFIFIQDNQYKGYEMELAVGFCKERGYGLDVIDMTWDSLIAAVQTGKSDLAACHIIKTPEREENVLFSDETYASGAVFSLTTDKAGSNAVPPKTDTADSFGQVIVNSFYKTFIKEDRWQLFVWGILVTLFITGVSIVAGTLLGYVIFMSQRKGNKLADALTRFLCWLIHGMPVVVLLMILFYIIFGGLSIDGMFVSAIGFTLVFAADVISDFKMGVGAVEKGQTEAAYALGYTDKMTFKKIILPQAAKHFMPSFKGNVVSLLKATAVVGYIAVQDLTKVSDIIRSRTYEAFFPLIVTAILYFILAAILVAVVKKIEFRNDPTKRTKEKILKDIDKNHNIS